MKTTKIVNLLQSLIFFPPWIILLNLILAAIIGYHAMKILLYSPPSTTSFPSYSPVTPSPLIPPVSVSPLIETHLFGAPQPEEAATVASPSPPPVTPLNLKLRGIYHSPDLSYAMITTAEDKTARYKMGDTLPGGAKLHEIRPKQVILLRNGQPETLYLEGATPSPPTTTAKPNQANRPEQLLGHYQRQLRTDPTSLIKLVRAYPVTQEGQLIGYRLSPGQDPTWMSQFNLQTGDIITAINGIQLDSPLKGLTVMEQLTAADHLDLQILRNGQSLPLSFSIDGSEP